MIRRARHLAAALLAGIGPAILAPAPAGAADTFLVGPGDRISVTVHRRADLSGEFRVLPGGALSLPFIGNLPVGGLSIDGIRDALVRRLRDEASLLDPRVSVEIAELQPILVAGVVRRPGQYPFQLGMTVGHAVALAGGMRRIDGEEIGARIEIARLREQLRQAQDGIGLALLARARWQAEAGGAEGFDAPADAERYLAPERLRQTLEAEREMARRRAAAFSGLLAILASQTAAFEEEIQALQDQSGSKDREAALIEQERDYIAALMRQGLTARDARVVQLARAAVQIEGDRRQILAFVARARQEIARVEQIRIGARTQRQLEFATGLKDAEDTLTRLRVTAEEARASLAELRDVLPPDSAPLGPPGAMSFSILRVRAPSPQRIAASTETLLLPGDLVEAGSDDPAPRRRVAAGAPG